MSSGPRGRIKQLAAMARLLCLLGRRQPPDRRPQWGCLSSPNALVQTVTRCVNRDDADVDLAEGTFAARDFPLHAPAHAFCRNISATSSASSLLSPWITPRRAFPDSFLVHSLSAIRKRAIPHDAEGSYFPWCTTDGVLDVLRDSWDGLVLVSAASSVLTPNPSAVTEASVRLADVCQVRSPAGPMQERACRR